VPSLIGFVVFTAFHGEFNAFLVVLFSRFEQGTAFLSESEVVKSLGNQGRTNSRCMIKRFFVPFDRLLKHFSFFVCKRDCLADMIHLVFEKY